MRAGTSGWARACCVDLELGSAGRLVTSLEFALGAWRAAEQVCAVSACSGSSGGIELPVQAFRCCLRALPAAAAA